MLKILRILLAAVCFVGLNLAFLGFSARFSLFARGQFFPALLALDIAVIALWVAVTLVFGRLYCAVACPLGVLQDLVFFVRRLVVRPRFAFAPARWLWRTVLLAAVIAACAFGWASHAGLVEPYSVYGRLVGRLVEPALQAVIRPEFAGERIFCGVAAFATAVVSLVAVGALAGWRGRIFCNAVCPVGTALGALSRRPLVGIRLDPAKCVSCGKCVAGCRAQCIDLAGGRVDQSRCTRCFDCLGTCAAGALRFGR